MNLHDRKDKRVEYRVLILNSNPYVVRAKKITDSISSILLISAVYCLGTSSPSLRFLASDFTFFLAVMGVELALGLDTGALALIDVVVVVVVRLAMDGLGAGELIARSESAIVTLSGVDDIACDCFLARHNEY